MADNIDHTELEADVVEDMMEKDIADAERASEEANTSETENEAVDTEETSEEADTESGEEKEKKSFFKKKKDKKDEKIDELNDRLIRTMAEFDNFRKRSEKEKAQMFEIGVSEEEKESAFVQGIDKIYKQLVQTLDAAGVKPIEAVGKEFDPNFHNAVMHTEDESVGDNIIVEEFQKGYTYRESVVRHSMVKVAN